MVSAKRIGWAIIVAMIAVDVGAGSAALAERTDISGSRTVTGDVPMNQHDLYVVNPADNHAISLHLTISSGGPVDVFTMDASDYSQYTSSSATTFEYYRASSRDGVTTFSVQVAPDTNPKYFVIDNDDHWEGTSPAGDVTYSITFTDADVSVSSSLNWLGGALLLFFLIFGGTIIRYGIRRSRRNRAAAAAFYNPGMAPAYGGQPGTAAYGQGTYGQSSAMQNPQYGTAAYGQGTATQNRPYGTAAPPPPQTAAQMYGPPRGQTYAPAQTAACPTCGASVTVGATSCQSCGMGLSWG